MKNEYLNNKYLESTIAKFQKAKKDKANYEILLISLRKNPKKRVRRIDTPGLISIDECEREYAQCVKDHDEAQLLLADSFYTLSANIVQAFKFNLIDMDDATQEGVMICFEKIDRFNPEIGKAFNYMTTCILNHFRQLYRTARNYNELKKKYHDFMVQSQTEQPHLKRAKDRAIQMRMAAKNSKDD